MSAPPHPLPPPRAPTTSLRIAQASPATETSEEFSPSPSPTPPPAFPPASYIAWKSVERKASCSGKRPVSIGSRHFPWNSWNLLRPGITFAVLHVLSKYFSLSDTFLLLHLEDYEIHDVKELLRPCNRKELYDIHADDVEEAKRVLAANVKSATLLGDLWRRLEGFEGARTSREEIEEGKFDLPKGMEGRIVAACVRRRGSGREGGSVGSLDSPGLSPLA
ncbi:hypothetical protein ACEPPN_015906 [Leptodophora sp. 'Broadleaf-Isolate-01']